ncbi:ABC transporter ATP-binding protein [Aureimonas fodinaquatilis]|uniref:ABC transporter ATP-binding protein n=1 Tax=Aureimonas fodinaquatilis TaxID=2565783 RepID=A0A5B0E2V7_9HYPH|nr:ABC transporter ATP-binding protein [Aureimonas fodinaquatilis]KAA0971759.1 ABC transporter ATP-binding protein [Aureimonas fodinaquatilis]
MKALLALEGIDARYDKVRALNDVSIHLNEGEIVALIGANGAGKSTTLRAITGLVRPHAGQIHWDGQRIEMLRPDQIVARGISMVPEGRHVYPFMSIHDNLLMGAFLRRDKVGIANDLERLFVRFPRLKERYRQQAGTLSGGEQQMVAIGRALMARPRLLLLDEPSLGLAPQVIREIARVIKSVNQDDKVSILLVEQNSRMALKVSHRAYALATGRVALQGNSEDLLGNEDIRKLYLGVA